MPLEVRFFYFNGIHNLLDLKRNPCNIKLAKYNGKLLYYSVYI